MSSRFFRDLGHEDWRPFTSSWPRNNFRPRSRRAPESINSPDSLPASRASRLSAAPKMWLLDSELLEGLSTQSNCVYSTTLHLSGPDAAPGRKLWLRPGNLYLFGRTVSERKSSSIDLLACPRLTLPSRPASHSGKDHFAETSHHPSRQCPGRRRRTLSQNPLTSMRAT